MRRTPDRKHPTLIWSSRIVEGLMFDCQGLNYRVLEEDGNRRSSALLRISKKRECESLVSKTYSLMITAAGELNIDTLATEVAVHIPWPSIYRYLLLTVSQIKVTSWQISFLSGCIILFLFIVLLSHEYLNSRGQEFEKCWFNSITEVISSFSIEK